MSQPLNWPLKMLKKLLPKAQDFSLEGILLENENYEVSLSYVIEADQPSQQHHKESAGLGALLKVIARRREEKIFIISQSGDFKGFRNLNA